VRSSANLRYWMEDQSAMLLYDMADCQRLSRNVAQRLAYHLARPTRMGWKVPELRQTIAHRHYRFGIVQMDARLEGQCGEHGGVDIGAAKARMIDHDMAAASGAEAPFAHGGLLEAAEMLAAADNAHILIPRHGTGFDG